MRTRPSRRQDGYKAHVVVEPDTGIITDTVLTPAGGADNSDAAVGIELLLAESEDRFEVLADSAYGSGEALAALTEAGHTAIIKPWPLRPAVAGGFTLDDFTVTEPREDQPGTVSCPNGHTRPLTPARSVTFGVLCRDCPLRERCTTSNTGRTLRLHPHDAITRAHRQRAQDPSSRPSTATTGPWWNAPSPGWSAGGNRRLRFRGTAANNQWLHHRVAGLNLRRLLALGLTRTAGAWALA